MVLADSVIRYPWMGSSSSLVACQCYTMESRLQNVIKETKSDQQSSHWPLNAKAIAIVDKTLASSRGRSHTGKGIALLLCRKHKLLTPILGSLHVLSTELQDVFEGRCLCCKS